MMTRRKLAAILSADVQGYSRLMNEGDSETVATLKSHFQAMSDRIRENMGRVVDFTGDNLLAEFPSAVDAVRSAAAIQETLRSRNGELPGNRRMVFRIGISLGDVIEDEGKLYGDGVNIAARIEQLAEGGAILVSGTVFDQVEKKLPFGYEYLGKETVKNFPEPLRIYRVVPTGAGVRDRRLQTAVSRNWKKALLYTGSGLFAATLAVFLWSAYNRIAPPGANLSGNMRIAPSLPGEPSIAVLPFANLSGDPDKEHLGDGIADDIITTLSAMPRLFVISRNSTTVYKKKPANVRDISRDLGVRYVLEGSIQGSGNRLRVNAQLIDGTTESHVWAQRYDVGKDDLFHTRNQLLLDLATALAVKLTDGEVATIMRRNTKNLAAWEAKQRGTRFYERYTPEDNIRAREHYRRAVELDPKYVNAWCNIGFTYYIEGREGTGEVRRKAFRKAVEIAGKARDMDPSYYASYMLLSLVQTREGKFEEALANARKAVELEPNFTNTLANLATTLNYYGNPEEAIVLMQRAMRLSPFYRPWYLDTLGLSYHLTGQYDKAIETFRESIRRAPASIWPHARLVVLYSELGREEEMRAEAAEILRLDPKFTIRTWSARAVHRDPKVSEHRDALLRKAGLPE